MNKKQWQKFAGETWGWSYIYSGWQYDLYMSGYRGIDLHDNTIMLADSH